MAKRIIVTGAGGYIGSMLTPYLLKKGLRVRAIDRYFFGNLKIKNKNLEIINDDIRLLKDKHFKNADYMIDLAAISNDVTGERYKKETFDINHLARVRNAKLAKKNGIKKYILPSSCSNYGKIKKTEIATENFKLRPLTNYSKANSYAEKDILNLASNKFCVTVLRQGTVYGYSPKMRFDLVVNRMTYEAWKNNKILLMKDGTQRRPTLHIKDAIRAMFHILNTKNEIVNEQIFNVGGSNNNYMIKDLADVINNHFKNKLDITWYGSNDHRSYFVSFDKIKNIGYKTNYSPFDGVKEIISYLNKGKIDLVDNTITLDWYETLEKWNNIIKNININNKIIKF